MLIFQTCFNILIFIGKTKNLTSLRALTLQDKECQQNGALKKILDLINLIYRCLILGLDLELFALILKLIQILLCITMVYIIDTLLLILILIYATQQSTITVKVTRKLRNFYQISIFSCGHTMNILIFKNINKDQPQKVSLTKIKYSLLLRITTLQSCR